MQDEFDYDLTPDQWETLKALRSPASRLPRMSRHAIDGLIALGLAAINGDAPGITPTGRRVLVRGSSRLLQDLAA
ncbi:hypothetical protein [Bradyrhizobium sp.]|uniref:hypothetical protein n=1 Tax=Bradyrhizobium sp. TaxID=376 RepID=UPI0025C329DD|nr:hypothetical protein [Bradyrhizobium sp.]